MTEEFEGSKTKDYLLFDSSLQYLHDELWNDYINDDRSVIIALSRKGPKILDIVFSEEELKHLNIVTEFAIPIVFKQMNRDVVYRIYVVDDAIYYGTTLLNLYREIKEYENIYGLKIDYRGAYVAIQDKGALKFEKIEIHGLSRIRDGYGHYFVRQIMSKFRLRHLCMEVEYPVITYELDNEVNLDQLRYLLKSSKYPFYDNKYDKESVSVLTVTLPENDRQFCKFRIYPNGHILHVAFMAPRIIPDTDSVLIGLMNNMPNNIIQFWKKICEYMLDSYESGFSDGVKRNKRRNLVSLANYIFSYQDFLNYKQTIGGFLNLSQNKILTCGIQKTALYQQLGSWDLANDLYSALSIQERFLDFRYPDIFFSTVSGEDQLYEEYKFPTRDERYTLAAHNEHMVRNSLTYKEALSAIFFNQNTFIERWSRFKARFDGRHLWFGYTHNTLSQILRNYSRFKLPPNLDTLVHEWIDERIDQGCIVPQYILDNDSNHWVRVFRPGENEDILLSHLGRFVLYIYKVIDRRLGLGYIPLSFFENMLSVVYLQQWDNGLADEFCFKLQLDEDKILCLSRQDTNSNINVVNLLRKMYIIEINDDEITIAPRISDPDFLSQTTLDSEIQKKIDRTIYTVLSYFEKSNVSVSNAQSIFNYYLNTDVSVKILKDTYQSVAKKIKEAIKMIENNIDMGNHIFVDEKCRDLILEGYAQIYKYDINNVFFLQDNISDDIYQSKFNQNEKSKSQTEFKRLIYLINLIILVFAFSDINDFIQFVEESDSKSLGMSALQVYIDNAVKQHSLSQLQHTHFFTGTLKHILSEIESE